jgi:hypothetical protein
MDKDYNIIENVERKSLGTGHCVGPGSSTVGRIWLTTFTPQAAADQHGDEKDWGGRHLK